MTFPEIKDEETAPDVETATAAYAMRFAGSVGTWLLDVQAQVTRRLLGDQDGSVLDVGGGHGQNLPVLTERFDTVVVHGSSPACEMHIRPWTEQGAVRFVVGPLTSLPFASQEFDVVIAYRLLAHVEDWPAFVAELCRVARKMVLVDYPSKQSVNAVAGWFFAAKKRIEHDTRPYRVLASRDVDAAFAREGFRCDGRIGQFVWPMAMHRALQRVSVSRMLERGAAWLRLHHHIGSPVIARYERQGAV
ncbi:class I SAM-dependent methyltransferase [Rhodocaloribacter litoris]|uniref:class I SAM-dependent methyltransferase n=1 Tax=Rhodocaloribacter litoris TaxID=2558931 RepID=UPI001420D1A8|nr:class I SAM-dependent methyltransferase [Rhodocaloribacter litoris]QXD16207.1 class I SAM-dependent methyltransferase [Rhodocaloribacter litoris]